MGNLAEDYLTAKERLLLPKDILVGTVLHREIDRYTDAHPLVREGANLIQPEAGRYAPVFTDLIWDHFLALSWAPGENRQFANRVYGLLKREKRYLPQKLVRLIPYMISEDVLYQIRTEVGIRKSIQYMIQRAKFLPKDAQVFSLFQKNSSEFQRLFDQFYPDLEQHITAFHLPLK